MIDASVTISFWTGKKIKALPGEKEKKYCVFVCALKTPLDFVLVVFSA